MAENLIRKKSYSFALEIIALYRTLSQTHEYVLSKQVLRSGTSIGANVEEAIQAQSKKDFISKMSIALKEANETHYWLRLLRDSGFLTSESVAQAIDHIQELLRILTAIIKSSKQDA